MEFLAWAGWDNFALEPDHQRIKFWLDFYSIEKSRTEQYVLQGHQSMSEILREYSKMKNDTTQSPSVSILESILHLTTKRVKLISPTPYFIKMGQRHLILVNLNPTSLPLMASSYMEKSPNFLLISRHFQLKLSSHQIFKLIIHMESFSFNLMKWWLILKTLIATTSIFQLREFKTFTEKIQLRKLIQLGLWQILKNLLMIRIYSPKNEYWIT